MKISIWYNFTEDPCGGANSFLRRLGMEFINLGHQVTFGYNPGCDIMLLNSAVCGPSKYLKLGEVSEIWATGKLSDISRIPFISLFFKMFFFSKRASYFSSC